MTERNTIKLKLGCYYVNRAGAKIGPIVANRYADSQMGCNREQYPFAYTAENKEYTCTSTGRAGYDSYVDSEHDIVAAWPDIYTLTTAFGLLHDATKIALQNHGGLYMFYNRWGDWEPITSPAWGVNTVYRAVPDPVLDGIKQDFYMDAKGDLYNTQYKSDFIPVTRIATTVNGVLDLAHGYLVMPRIGTAVALRAIGG